jgi:hypothetical protein
VMDQAGIATSAMPAVRSQARRVVASLTLQWLDLLLPSATAFRRPESHAR